MLRPKIKQETSLPWPQKAYFSSCISRFLEQINYPRPSLEKNKKRRTQRLVDNEQLVFWRKQTGVAGLNLAAGPDFPSLLR